MAENRRREGRTYFTIEFVVRVQNVSLLDASGRARARKTLWIVVIDVFCVIFIGIALLLRSLSLSSCSVEVEVEVPVCRAISSALFCRYQR